MTTPPPPTVPAWRRVPVGAVLLAVVAYVPLLLTRPGEVGADTKTYLYLDPGRLLSRAAWMWDTNIGFGTVTHQNIGYLWPMGPYYWAMETLRVPDWIAQRLWLGTIIVVAGLGVRYMLRQLRWEGAGVTVASFAYAFSPYLLHYGARISVILLPFAGLPWLIGLAAASTRRGGWRWPAAFALVTLTVGGVNATSLILVMAGPVLWMLHAVFVAKEVPLRRAVGAGLRITALTAITSFWWIAGLSLQGSYGIPILRYTETYKTVANAALSTELLRGLGYWFFYGRDALGVWIAPAARLVQNIPALFLSFLVPGLALLGGFLTRFRNRGYFALLVAAGILLGVGAHPWDAPSPAGAVFKAWTTTDAGLAFRSTPRALPLSVLGLAVMLGAGVAALSRMRPSWHPVLAGGAIALVLLNQLPLFAGEMVDRNLTRDQELPSYWLDAAAAMDAGGRDTRVYELPGTDFASYRWGNTVDPITPGLIDRPYAARELIPYGTPASANLLNEWDVPLQQGSFDPAALVPVAQLFGIGTIVHRGDLQYERFRTPRPRNTWHLLNQIDGLGDPVTFGADVPNEAVSELPLDDEVLFGTPPDWEDAPAVSLFDLEDPRPVTRAVSATSPTVMAGNGAGIVSWAGTGALDPDRPIFYSASFAEDPDGLDALIEEPAAQLVVTDTNRRAARRWGSVRENDGYTEMAGESALEDDPTDNRLDVFPGAGDDAYTVTEQVGGATLAASGYANPVSYTPADRASRAMDGDPATAWRVAAFDEPRGEYLRITLDEPRTLDGFTLLQSLREANRWITEVEVSLDGDEPFAVPLGEASRALPGQVVEFPSTEVREITITITEANVGVLDRYVGVSDVGIAEVTIPGVDPVTDVIRPPTDLLDAAGDASLDRDLTYVFQRRFANPAEVVVDDEEPQMRRWVEGPSDRSFTVFGSARISPKAPEPVIDDLLGVPQIEAGGVRATTSAHLAGDISSRGNAAIDGDPSTAWQTPLNRVTGNWIEVTSQQPMTFDELRLEVVRDGRHSVPTGITVQTDDGQPIVAEIPEPGLGSGPLGSTTTIVVPVPRQSGNTVRVTIDAIEEANSKDWFAGGPTVLPVGIAELGLPVSGTPARPAATFDSGCRDDLLTVEGAAVPLRARGTVAQVLERAPLQVSQCGAALEVAAGRSLLETVPGSLTGIDLDQVTLASAAGGGPGVDTLEEGAAPAPPSPDTTVTQPSRLSWSVDVDGAEEPYWVVLGQSLSPGFTATIDGRSLGEPTLVNGYANGWLVDPAEFGADAIVEISWTPQRLVWIALALSAVGVLVCLVLALLPSRFRRPRRTPPSPGDGSEDRREDGGGEAESPSPAMTPVVTRPLAPSGSPLAPGRTALIALGVAAAALVAAGPAVGVAVGLLTAVALGVRHGQVALRAVGLGLWAAAAAFVVLKQYRNDFLADFNWMNQFELTHAWTLTVVLLLVADPFVAWLRDAAERRRGAPMDDGSTV